MLAPHKAESGSASAHPWADLLRRHRNQWVASLAGERGVSWHDDYTGAERGEPSVDELRATAAEGRPVIVGLRADATGAAARQAHRLAAELGGVTVCQRLAAGSLMSAEATDPADAVHFLVCVNLDVTSGAAGMTDAEVVPLMTGYVRFLEEANRSLSEANVKLARERLGLHDSAAAKLVADLDAQLEAAHASYEAMLETALMAPRYRAVDKLRDLLFQVPGISALLRLRSRLIRSRANPR
jgi:hypothetical protein